MDMVDKKMADSISALRQYIAKDKEHMGRHNARILVHANKKDCSSGIRIVCVTIQNDWGQVIVENLHTIYSSCSNIFTTTDSYFSFISGTLCIKTIDALGEEINIDIT